MLICGVLTGCAYAPGMTMSAAGLSQAPQDGGVPLPQWLRTYEPVPDRHGGYAADGKPATGVLFPITPDLIRLQRAQQANTVADDVKRLSAVARPYAIGPGDVLNIVVWDHPELTLPPAGSSLATEVSSLSGVGNGYNVSAEGLIQFPLLGSIKLSGMTESQARQVLVTQLGKYIKSPEITLRIQAYRSGRVYVDGEVRLPGLQFVNDIPMTLPEAIGRAGGFSAAADRSAVAITRNGSTALINLPQLAQAAAQEANTWGLQASLNKKHPLTGNGA